MHALQRLFVDLTRAAPASGPFSKLLNFFAGKQPATSRGGAYPSKAGSGDGRGANPSVRRLRIPGGVKPASTPIKGVYLWGGVGRGKTHLMDLFYEALPVENKLRLHFHRLMCLVHDSLKRLKDLENPLEQVAREFSQRATIICLDELQVSDITDAMILGQLFDALYAQGVVLVMTSNQAPDALYRDGLQRARFLPAIAQIKQQCEVLELKGEQDYRMSALNRIQTWFVPPSDIAERALLNSFRQLAALERHADRSDVLINGRRIPVRRWADGVAWFEFTALCDTPRATADYIEIARYFHTVLISNVPKLTPDREDAARRWISMIDEFYDRHVKLLVSAEADPAHLYAGHRQTETYRRTRSRLEEMQTPGYLSRIHLSN